MKFDKLKPNLQELNLNGVKKAASRVAHVRIRLSRGQWIGVIAGLVVVTVLLVILLRPRPAAVVLPVVAVEPVTTEDVNIYGDYVGRIRAQQFVEIRARVDHLHRFPEEGCGLLTKRPILPLILGILCLFFIYR